MKAEQQGKGGGRRGLDGSRTLAGGGERERESCSAPALIGFHIRFVFGLRWEFAKLQAIY